MSNTVKCDIVKKMCMLSGESAKSVSFMVTCKYGMHWNGLHTCHMFDRVMSGSAKRFYVQFAPMCSVRVCSVMRPYV